MTREEYNKLKALIRRKEFLDATGLSDRELDTMVAAYETKHSGKGIAADLSVENVKLLLAADQMPVWRGPVGLHQKKTAKGRKTKKPKSAYAKYFRAVLGVMLGYRS